jgi:hypothetical protein
MRRLDYEGISNPEQYDQLLKDLYAKVGRNVEEVEIPPIKVIAVDGNEPPDSEQYQTAIGCLYGIGYTLKMGLKFGRLPRPTGYFDYPVGGLGSLWWSVEGAPFDIRNPETLRWKAYLMVPPFVDEKLFQETVAQARAKKPEVPFEQVRLEILDEGRSLQVLHIGPYDQELPTIELLNETMKREGLEMAGKHHEIYISDPRRTPPEKLRTVIRHPVRNAE